MNPDNGFIREFATREDAEKEGYTEEVQKELLTKLQARRLEEDIQPVIAPGDRRSKLYKQKRKAQKKMKLKSKRRNR